MVQAVHQRYSFSDYLDIEEMSPLVKHEFFDGGVWAMAGGSPDHAALAANVIRILGDQLLEKPCRVFTSDLRIRVKETGLGTYPDATVVCHALELDPADPKGHTVVNPTVLVEVLSPSTEEYDLGEKREHYQTIPSLREIVFVAHGARRVDVWRREEDRWTRHSTVEGAAILESIDCTLPLDGVYFDALRPRAEGRDPIAHEP
jgi:Uma2 family endonuclease